MIWCNNGTKQTKVHSEADIPDGFQRGRLPMSASQKAKTSASMKGKRNACAPKAAEHKAKISASMKGKPKPATHKANIAKAMTDEARAARSKACENLFWATDGQANVRYKLGETIPPGFIPGRTISKIEKIFINYRNARNDNPFKHHGCMAFLDMPEIKAAAARM